MSRLSRIYVRFIRLGFRRRHTLARLTKTPLLGRMLQRTLFDGDSMVYLPKDDVAKASLERSVRVDPGISVEPQDVVLPSRVAEEFVMRAEDLFLMDFCVCRESNRCEDYPWTLGCLFLGRAIRKIDPGLGRRVTREEALEHLRRCREAGLVHLIGRNKLDTVWLSAGPKEELMTICSCCPCCCLWKMLPDLSEGISDRIMRMPGAEVRIDAISCTGCGACAEEGVCFIGAVSMRDGTAAIDQRLCRACGRCVESCPTGAIRLHLDGKASFDDAVKRLDGLAERAKTG